jgi:hypothetical protein
VGVRMVVKRTSGFVVGALLVATLSLPASAATSAQVCTGPSATTQSGRATFDPGLNARPAAQTVGITDHLFSCTAAAVTGTSGTLKSTFIPTAAQTCTLITTPHVLGNKPARISWKNATSSALTLTYSLTGSSRLINVTGRVNTGPFSGHSLTGQFRYQPVVSPNPDSVAQACANTVAPGGSGRIKVIALNLFMTKHFVIN